MPCPAPLDGWLAAAGIAPALALAVPVPGVALVGFSLVGLGLSIVVPMLISAASRTPGVAPAHGIAAVSGVGYLGMMLGSLLIDPNAGHSSLDAGLRVVMAFSALMALSARRALERRDCPIPARWAMPAQQHALILKRRDALITALPPVHPMTACAELETATGM